MKRILIIDDDASVRETFLAALADRNYTLAAADGGAAGLESAKQNRPDLVFLDLKMPEMNGVETLTRLHGICPGVPVFIVTAFYAEFLKPLKDVRHRGITFDLARKPLTLAEIRAIADGALMNIDTAPSLVRSEMNSICVRLYVTGQTPSAERAIASLEELRKDFAGRMTVEVIDVLDDPVSALNDDVYATPTVFRIAPEPVRRLFGDLSRKETLIAGLGLER